jgi:4-amino-4-deoxy-L-arabinose transferase-like glycosyltransferase
MKRTLEKISAPLFLAGVILVSYLPFLNLRVLRMAGDEKVYISQSIEMARHGHWFAQRLADTPDYYKGPLHYLFLRIGMLIFGNQLIAATYMNALLALVAGLLMYRLGKKRWNETAGLFLGLATALNVGVFSHALASQMEVELTAFYAFALASLAMPPKRSPYFRDLPFWLVTGLCGWVKSPLHSVLIGTSGLLFWAVQGELFKRAREAGAWAAVFSGMALSVAGFLPAALLDWPNFYSTYLLRETFQKGGNGNHWSYVLKPLLHFTLPWTFVLFAALLPRGKKRAGRKWHHDPMLTLGLCLALPSIVFWTCWSYKGQNYNLPTLPALFLAAWAVLSGKFPRWAFQVTGALGAVAAVVLLLFYGHFWPLPDWYPKAWLVLSIGSVLIFSGLFIFAKHARLQALGVLFFLLRFRRHYCSAWRA